jgi:hypothetical protein
MVVDERGGRAFDVLINAFGGVVYNDVVLVYDFNIDDGTGDVEHVLTDVRNTDPIMVDGGFAIPGIGGVPIAILEYHDVEVDDLRTR